MINRLRENITERLLTWALWWIVRREIMQEISLRECWKEVKSCLVFWPGDGLDVSAGKIILKRLRLRFPNATLTILSLPGIGASPPYDMAVKIIKIEKESLNFLGFPLKVFRNQLDEVKADLAVDLSLDYNPLSAYLCKLSKARISMSFADPRCDMAYNFQIAPQPGRQVLDRYRVMARYIG